MNDAKTSSKKELISYLGEFETWIKDKAHELEGEKRQQLKKWKEEQGNMFWEVQKHINLPLIKYLLKMCNLEEKHKVVVKLLEQGVTISTKIPLVDRWQSKWLDLAKEKKELKHAKDVCYKFEESKDTFRGVARVAMSQAYLALRDLQKSGKWRRVKKEWVKKRMGKGLVRPIPCFAVNQGGLIREELWRQTLAEWNALGLISDGDISSLSCLCRKSRLIADYKRFSHNKLQGEKKFFFSPLRREKGRRIFRSYS